MRKAGYRARKMRSIFARARVFVFGQTRAFNGSSPVGPPVFITHANWQFASSSISSSNPAVSPSRNAKEPFYHFRVVGGVTCELARRERGAARSALLYAVPFACALSQVPIGVVFGP